MSRRDALLITLMQEAQRAGGWPMVDALIDLPGGGQAINPELSIDLNVWRRATVSIPDEALRPAFDRACLDFDFGDTRKRFTPDRIATYYSVLIVEERQRAEAERRNAMRRNPGTYACQYCLDEGYEQVWQWNGRWSTARRPCECEATPLTQRQPALREPEYERNRIGQWVKAETLAKHGWRPFFEQGRSPQIPPPVPAIKPEEVVSDEPDATATAITF